MKLFSLLLAGMSVVLIAETAEASITINASDFSALAQSGHYTQLNVLDGQSFDPTPYLNEVNDSDGGNTSSNDIDWRVTNGQTVLSLDMTHERTGTSNTLVKTISHVYFTADSNSSDPFELLGNYKVTDKVINDETSSGTVYLYADLHDLTANSYPFMNLQYSQNTPNEEFVLGGLGGDFSSDLLVGGLTGNLFPTHQYEFTTIAYTQAYPGSDFGNSATGNFTLKIGTAETSGAVPEPLSLMVWVGLIAATVISTGKCSRS